MMSREKSVRHHVDYTLVHALTCALSSSTRVRRRNTLAIALRMLAQSRDGRGFSLHAKKVARETGEGVLPRVRHHARPDALPEVREQSEHHSVNRDHEHQFRSLVTV